ncbi:hypothetical protein QF000_005396 [Paraburkholderia atlantica]|uniref:Uncharacterized protein n=1 Tax=Paraburkholderia atlantica TaxID=2654982 RepID=A0A7W8QA94_PARAM|nr:hypothetical protein [Paraburkholderia atlantica]MBB5426168.1 hypothetical protein [Paraburkholderia atlantica]
MSFGKTTPDTSRNEMCPQPFYTLPGQLIVEFADLPGDSWKLLNQFAILHNGHNNGRLRISRSFARAHGWNSNAAFQTAFGMLLDVGLITVTRHSTGSAPHLVALTWLPWTDHAGENHLPALALSEKKVMAARVHQHRLDAKVIIDKNLARQKLAAQIRAANQFCGPDLGGKSAGHSVCGPDTGGKPLFSPAVSIPVEQFPDADDTEGVF